MGLVLYKNYSEFAVLDVAGNFLRQGRIENDTEKMRMFAESMPLKKFISSNRILLPVVSTRAPLRRGGHAAGCGCALGENGEEIHIQPITGT